MSRFEPASSCDANRRALIVRALGAAIACACAARDVSATGTVATPERRWFDAAARMKRLAESWGDQPYGAVLVLGGEIVGEGPSRVVKHGDPTAHAEREAIRDAQRRLNRADLQGSVLYSTSRPCPACEAASAGAGVARMYFGEGLHDAGVPKR
jgi:tRNA(adenine34) deaminase